MILYHRTTVDSAQSILKKGFRDSSGYYGMDRKISGVWLSDRKVDENEGAKSGALLEVEIAEEIIADYECLEDGKPYREWVVPAVRINKNGRVTLLKEDY